MTIKVSDVMRHVRNHFIQRSISGAFSHTDGRLTPDEHFRPGMWIAVTGDGAPSGVFQLRRRRSRRIFFSSFSN